MKYVRGPTASNLLQSLSFFVGVNQREFDKLLAFRYFNNSGRFDAGSILMAYACCRPPIFNPAAGLRFCRACILGRCVLFYSAPGGIG